MADRFVKVVDGVEVPLTQEEIDRILAERAAYDPTIIEAEVARQKRNGLLTQCDWTQLPDAKVDAQAWATYRQALRDISSQSGFPMNIVWPVKPE